MMAQSDSTTGQPLDKREALKARFAHLREAEASKGQSRSEQIADLRKAQQAARGKKRDHGMGD